MSPAKQKALTLPEKIVALHETLAGAQLPHAFGGALALAWCTKRARGTIGIDINVFVEVDDCLKVFDAMPDGVKRTAKQRAELKKEGQVRLWWDKTPVDIFLNTTPFHADAAKRVRWEKFVEQDIPFIACNDLAVFKAFFNRTQDWADLEAMYAAGTLDVKKVAAVISEYLGPNDMRLEKLNHL